MRLITMVLIFRTSMYFCDMHFRDLAPDFGFAHNVTGAPDVKKFEFEAFGLMSPMSPFEPLAGASANHASWSPRDAQPKFAGTAFALILLIVFLVLPSHSASATDYYLSPTGNDTSPGTAQVAPWKTFAHAIPKLNPGDTLNLLNGTYQPGTGTGFPNINCSSGAQNGTSSAPITIQALNERQALIQGDGSTEPFQMNNCSYWNIVGLDVQDGDWPSGENNATVDLENSNHLVFRRNILAHSNRCHNLHLVQVGPNTTNSLFEENEFYYFHRHSLYFWSNSNNNESRRNYANPRTYGGPFTCSSGTYDPQADSTAGFNYGSHFNIIENVIAENVPQSFGDEPIGTAPAACSNSVGDNQWLGDIALNSTRGYTSHPHSSGPVCVPNNLTFKNVVVIHPSSVGMYLRASTNVSVTNLSMFSTGVSNGNVVQDNPPENSTPPSSTFTNDEQVPATSPTGYSINTGTSTLDHVGAFGATISNKTVTNPITANPAYGSCFLWAPDASPLKRVGAGGADVGANVLYQYVAGALTTNQLWDPVTGDPLFKGATVAGLNDVPAGSCGTPAYTSGRGCSLFDIANRLNINKNGCSFAAGYSSQSNQAPAAPTGLNASVQ